MDACLYKKNIIRYPFYSLYSIALILVGIVYSINWIIGMIELYILLLACLFLYMKNGAESLSDEFETYISMPSHQLKKSRAKRH